MLQDLRELLNLSVEQVADELNLTTEQVTAMEQADDQQYAKMFCAAFPVNRAVLRFPEADPFLASYDQTSPGKRLEKWLVENNVSASAFAEMLGVGTDQVIAFTRGDGSVMTRAQGEEIERKTGINRKWLMYGDGREKGKAIARAGQGKETRGMTMLEMMAADFSKLPERTAPKHQGRRSREERENREAERKALGLKVRETRKASGLSLKQAADVLGLSVSRVTQMECGIVTDRKAEEITKKLEAAAIVTSDTEDQTRLLEKEPDRKLYGEAVRKIRKAAGLSLKQAADYLDISFGRVGQIECGYVTEEQAREILERLYQVVPQEAAAAVRPVVDRLGIPEEGEMSWSERIRVARRAAGLSQTEVADMIGMSHASISAMERGRVREETARMILEKIQEIQG